MGWLSMSMGEWRSMSTYINTTYINIILPSEMCIDGYGHCIEWIPSQTSAGHPYDKDEVCIKCGQNLAEYRWNGIGLIKDGHDPGKE